MHARVDLGLSTEGGAGGIEHLVRCGMAEQGLLLQPAKPGPAAGAVEVLDVLADEEHLPFPPGSFDLIVRWVPAFWLGLLSPFSAIP